MRGAVMVAGRWFVTPHAVQRYRERIDPRATYDEALAYLIAASNRAHPVKEIEPGLWMWREGAPRRLRYRVSTNGDGLPQLVTVLTPFDGYKPCAR